MQKNPKPPKPILLLCFTTLWVLLFAFFGFAALDPEFGSRGRGAVLFRLIPRPAISIISWSVAALAIWAMWRPLFYRWKQRPHFIFNSFGFAGLSQQIGIISPMTFARCRWRDVIAVDRIQSSKRLHQIRIKCQINGAAAQRSTLSFGFSWLEKPAIPQLEFLSLLSTKRPDLRAQIDSALSASGVATFTT